ncbi:MAG TPA: hypothetical protein VH372_13175 [Actinospica sp.]|nr:hypothetical protein [Actinospica sp.]
MAIVAAASVVLRRRALRRQFGPEYDRLASEVGPRRAREELTRRSRVVAELEIRPLSQERRDEYTSRWDAAQEQFVDAPAETTRTAAGLVTSVARDLGYSAGDEDKLFTELSVNHARALEGYRRARDAAGQASGQSTEVLRQVLIGYRTLFRELLAARGDRASGTAAAGAAEPAESPSPVEPDRITADATKE